MSFVDSKNAQIRCAVVKYNVYGKQKGTVVIGSRTATNSKLIIEIHFFKRLPSQLGRFYNLVYNCVLLGQQAGTGNFLKSIEDPNMPFKKHRALKSDIDQVSKLGVEFTIAVK